MQSLFLLKPLQKKELQSQEKNNNWNGYFMENWKIGTILHLSIFTHPFMHINSLSKHTQPRNLYDQCPQWLWYDGCWNFVFARDTFGKDMLERKFDTINLMSCHWKYVFLTCFKENIRIVEHMEFQEENVEPLMESIILHGMQIIIVSVYSKPYATLPNILNIIE